MKHYTTTILQPINRNDPLSQAPNKQRSDYHKLTYFKLDKFCERNNYTENKSFYILNNSRYPLANKVELIDSNKDSLTELVMSQHSLVDPNKIHLFVKAGQDGRSQGACPFCQTVFLQLLVKAKANKFNFDVLTINVDNPPKEFKELSLKPPVLIHGSSKLLDSSIESDDTEAVILSDVDEIAEYLDRLYPNSPLIETNPDATRVCLNVFSKFSFFIREVSSKSNSLEAELEKIDTYLKNVYNNEIDQVKFMNGTSHMSLIDCSLLPKLQHIRIAGESIKQFRIPYRLKFLWKYIKLSYETDSFQKSCPPDREIIWHWSKSFLSHKHLLQIIQEAPYKTLTLPDDFRF